MLLPRLFEGGHDISLARLAAIHDGEQRGRLWIGVDTHLIAEQPPPRAEIQVVIVGCRGHRTTVMAFEDRVPTES